MRTAHFSTSGDGSAQPSRMQTPLPPTPSCNPGPSDADPPPRCSPPNLSSCEHTGRCKNITLPQTSFAGGKNWLAEGTAPSFPDKILRLPDYVKCSGFSCLKSICSMTPMTDLYLWWYWNKFTQCRNHHLRKVSFQHFRSILIFWERQTDNESWHGLYFHVLSCKLCTCSIFRWLSIVEKHPNVLHWNCEVYRSFSTKIPVSFV